MPPLHSFSRRCLAIAISQALLVPAHAATITVDSHLDDNTDCTLREAIESIANASLEAGCTNTGDGFGVNDTVNFANLANSTIVLTNNQLFVDAPMTINGGAGITIVADASSRVLLVDAGPVTLTNITMTGGNVVGEGGGLRVQSAAEVHLVDSHITASSAVWGGGVDVREASTLMLTNSTITDNSASGRAGGIDVSGSSSLVLNGSTISGNTAGTQQGGGASITSGSSFSANNSTISNNVASNSGAGGLTIYEATLDLTNSTVSGNTAGGASGGGMSTSFSSVTITNSTVSGNYASNWGGGIFVATPMTMTLVNSTMIGNSSGSQGGAIAGFNYAIIDISNSVFTGNRTGSNGNELSDINTAIFNFSGINLIGDSSQMLADAISGLTLNGTDISATSDSNLPTAVANILLSLADNGGATETHAPATDSPLVGAADPTLCPKTDQRGKSRADELFVPIVGGNNAIALIALGDNACDIGSVEL